MNTKIHELMDVRWHPARVVVTGEDGDSLETSWRSFVTDNSEDLEMLSEAKVKLNAGLPYVGGGGAAPRFTVDRMDPIKFLNSPLVPCDPLCRVSLKSMVSRDPFDPKVVLQPFEELGAPEGDDYIATMRSIADEAVKRAHAMEALLRLHRPEGNSWMLVIPGEESSYFACESDAVKAARRELSKDASQNLYVCTVVWTSREPGES